MVSLKKEEIIILSITGLLLIISILMIKNFIIPLFFTLFLVFILNPVYKKLNKIIRNDSITSLIITILILLFLIFPIIFGIIELSKEITNIEISNFNSTLINLNNLIQNNFNYNINLIEQYNLILIKSKDLITSIVFKLPEIIFDIFIILFFYYYFSKTTEGKFIL